MPRMLRSTDKTDPFKSAFENPWHQRSNYLALWHRHFDTKLFISSILSFIVMALLLSDLCFVILF
jgi:hypothetical protein